MSTIKKLILVLFAAGFAAPILAAPPLTLDALKESAAVDAATPEGQAYLKQFFRNPWMVALDAADETCRSVMLASEPVSKGVIALSIGADGYPVAAFMTPEDKGTRCVAERLKSTQFIKPPHDGFAIYLPFEAVEPGSEREREMRATAEKASQ